MVKGQESEVVGIVAANLEWDWELGKVSFSEQTVRVARHVK